MFRHGLLSSFNVGRSIAFQQNGTSLGEDAKFCSNFNLCKCTKNITQILFYNMRYTFLHKNSCLDLKVVLCFYRYTDFVELTNLSAEYW